MRRAACGRLRIADCGFKSEIDSRAEGELGEANPQSEILYLPLAFSFRYSRIC